MGPYTEPTIPISVIKDILKTLESKGKQVDPNMSNVAYLSNMEWNRCLREVLSIIKSKVPGV